jgi:AcrR family transcriptional regulator
LAAPEGFSGFTVDAVAGQAGVARMTVYNQFGSKTGLLEALFDDLAARGLVGRLRAAFGRPEPREALADLIAAFAGFWHSDRIGGGIGGKPLTTADVKTLAARKLTQ